MNLSKITIVLALLAVVCLVFFVVTTNIDSAQPQTINFQGTVTRLNLEGGFWGIVSADGKHYDPLNLNARFQQEGLRVQVQAIVKDGMVSTHLWGTIIEITAISRVARVKSKISNHFAIILVKGVKTRDAIKSQLAELPLAAEPVLTDRDLLSYHWRKHQLELKPDFHLDRSVAQVPVDGLPFVVIADDQRVYLGAFWTPISSQAANIPVIMVPFTAPNQIQIVLGYPKQSNGQSDPRANQLIYEALISVAKLKE